MISYNGKQVQSIGLLGVGISNLGVLSYFSEIGELPEITVRCSEAKDALAIKADRRYYGKDMLRDIREDVLFLSPSARRDIPELSEAVRRGVILSSDTELFFSRCKNDVYAVTGSDGKSTTTYLSARLLNSAYGNAYAAGNFGVALSPLLHKPYDTAVVAELSSFTLNYTKPRSKRALITNITENHLNWHSSLDEYIKAKRNIFENAEERIFCYDCELSRKVASDFPIFAAFSVTAEERELRKKTGAELLITLANGDIVANGEPILPIKRIRTSGLYNVLNFMGAIALSYGKAEKKDILSLAESFSGLPHRRELIGEYRGVKYYDSSIDSTPKRCTSTLESFNEKVILILGGRSKGLDFKELIPTIKRKVKLLILTGECADEIEDILQSDKGFLDSGIIYAHIPDFTEAVVYAALVAKSGDSVLLSPAATSYDCFKNFEERGNVFRETVKGFGNERN